MQRAPSSCSPPRGVAANCAARRAARARPTARPNPRLNSRRFVLGAPPLAPLKRRPRRGRRFWESRYSLSPQSFPQSAPILWGSGCGVRPGHRRCPAAGPAALRAAKAQPMIQPQSKPHARLGAAGKPFSVFPPEEQAQPKVRPSSRPCVSPTAAPLSLRRCRSALERWVYLLLNVARGNSCRIGQVPTGRICPLSGRATGFSRAPLGVARVFGYRRVLRSGRAGPTSRGREMLAHFHWQPLPQQLTATSAQPIVRALAEILFKRESRV